MVQQFRLSKVSGKFIEILLWLIGLNREEIYVSELSKELKMSKSTVIKWLEELTKWELVTERKRGNMHYYRINGENPIIKQFKILQSVSELTPLMKSLKGMAEVYLFGSSARGEDRPDSDYDILVVTKLNSNEVFKKLKNEDRLKNRKISLLIVKPFEYADMAKHDPALYQRIEIDKIRLV
ncbi:MAG: nucleotidyltransferase domain-containing protein [Candidatus Nanoarchaeia archaeon]|nr:nucleotidyltransferase domain-containing protein [Candidatus Nanoarchaeia archaeon]MDD5239067.1 nucleotidyltransferase domain-containing protein [Candidatus Nanoarchaeia archaeon]